MSPLRLAALTAIALICFAGNSLLCRAAFVGTAIDPATFTSVRLVSGALTLFLLLATRGAAGSALKGGSWRAAGALFVYAAAFSFAYVSLPAATGALLLFGAVQITMIGRGLRVGERLRHGQWLGLLLAIAGLGLLLLPGATAAPIVPSLLMVAAGVAWGAYSLFGQGSRNALTNTAANFLRTLPIAALLSMLMIGQFRLDAQGLALAAMSGALTSALGYAFWYAALPYLRATQAATLQLSVPVLTAIAGVTLLAEPASARLLAASVLVIGGIALVLWQFRQRERRA